MRSRLHCARTFWNYFVGYRHYALRTALSNETKCVNTFYAVPRLYETVTWVKHRCLELPYNNVTESWLLYYDFLNLIYVLVLELPLLRHLIGCSANNGTTESLKWSMLQHNSRNSLCLSMTLFLCNAFLELMRQTF